jgi:hypothetical protein
MSDPRWLEMLRSAVERSGSIQAVADQLGKSRTAISLVINGKYGDRSTDQIERAVLAKLDFVACPHLVAEIARADCDGFRLRKMPRSDAQKLRHWVACGRCPISKAAAGIADEVRRAARADSRGEHV